MPKITLEVDESALSFIAKCLGMYDIEDMVEIEDDDPEE